MEKKSFGIALIVWLLFGGLGAHRVYVNENVWVLLVYWIGTFVTLGLLPIVDLFFIKGIVEEANKKLNTSGGNE